MSKTAEDIYTSYFNAGVEFLNKIYPGWHMQIDLDIFDMAEETKCILGQLFEGDVRLSGDFDDYLQTTDDPEDNDNGYMFAVWFYADADQKWAVRHGFRGVFRGDSFVWNDDKARSEFRPILDSGYGGSHASKAYSFLGGLWVEYIEKQQKFDEERIKSNV